MAEKVLLLHLADVHLGSGLRQFGISPEHRLKDLEKQLRRVVLMVKRYQPEFVVLAGDTFHTPSPSSKPFWVFAEFVNALRGLAQIVVVAGNHEQPGNVWVRTTMEGVARMGAPIHYAQRWGEYVEGEWRYTSYKVVEGREHKVAFICFPFLRIPRQRGESLDQRRRRLETYLKTSLQQALGAKEVRDADYRVVVGHLWVGEARVGKWQRRAMELTPYEVPVSLNVIANPRLDIDYVALGHVHLPQTLSDSPPTVYAGSVERIDFGEREEQGDFGEVLDRVVDKKEEAVKRIVAVVERGGGLEPQSIVLGCRRMIRLGRKEPPLEKPTEEFIRLLAMHDVAEAIVELQGEGVERVDVTRVRQKAKSLGVFGLRIIYQHRPIGRPEPISIGSRIPSIKEALRQYIDRNRERWRMQGLSPDEIYEEALKILREVGHLVE